MAGAPEGNTNAARGAEYRQALKRVMAREEGTASKGLEKVAAELFKAAIAGEQWAVKEVADRFDGRPAQAIVGDSEFDPVQVLHKILLGDLDDRGNR